MSKSPWNSLNFVVLIWLTFHICSSHGTCYILVIWWEAEQTHPKCVTQKLLSVSVATCGHSGCCWAGGVFLGLLNCCSAACIVLQNAASIWSRIYTRDLQPRTRASHCLELISLLCRLGLEQGSLWSVGVLCTGMKTLWAIFFWAVSHTVQIWVSHHCHRVSYSNRSAIDKDIIQKCVLILWSKWVVDAAWAWWNVEE